MSNYEATKYDFSGANLTGIEGVPSGTIVPWSTAIPVRFAPEKSYFVAS